MTTVVLLSLRTHYMSALYALRALGPYGYKIDLFFIGSDGSKQMSRTASSSKYVHNTHIFKGSYQDSIGILKKTYSDTPDKCILFPMGDIEAGLMDQNRDDLKQYFVMPGIVNGDNRDILAKMDKGWQAESASQAGLRVPQYTVVDLKKPFSRSLSDIQYPCYCKPSKSLAGSKTEMSKCMNEEELTEKLTSLRKTDSNREFIVQQFLDIKNEYAVTGACLDEEVYIAGISKKLATGIHTRGVTVLGEILDKTEFNGILPTLEKYLRQLHYVGQFDVDLIESNNTLYFNEVNFRISGIDYAFTRTGSNSPLVLTEYLENGFVAPQIKKKALVGKRFFNERCAFEDFTRGYIDKEQYKGLEEKANYTLLDVPEDPKPSAVFNKYKKKRLVKAFLKRVI